MTDDSEIYVQELNYAIMNLYKLCIEEIGYDIGDTKNKIEYHNYLYDNPIHLLSDEEVYNGDVKYEPLSEEDMKFLRNLNIQEGGEGLEHVGRFDSHDKFVKTLFNAYISKGVSSTIAVAMVAQNALESAWGTSHYAKFTNYGGISYPSQGADYVIPGKSSVGLRFSGYNNLGNFVNDKLRILNKNFPGSVQAQTPEDYFRILQGGSSTGLYYCAHGAERTYGPSIIRMIPTVKKYLA